MSFPTKIFAIVNPHAAHGRAGKRWPTILKCLHDRRARVVARLTERPWHAFHITREALRSGAPLIVSVGGEGTLNEIVNGMFHYRRSRRPELAMIPIGTGTDLSRTLRIPKQCERVVDMLACGKLRLIDIGKIVFRNRHRQWSRFFVNACDAGLGGSVVRIANSALKHLGGFLTFLASSLIALATFKPVYMQIWVDGVCVDRGRITIVGALNGQFFGGGMHAAPMAKIDDGVLECIYVKNTNIFKFVSHILAKVYAGEHLRYRNVHHCRATEIRIAGEKSFCIDVDGERERAQELIVTLMPEALKMRVPDA